MSTSPANPMAMTTPKTVVPPAPISRGVRCVCGPRPACDTYDKQSSGVKSESKQTRLSVGMVEE